MAKYLVNAPDKMKVTVSCGYGTLSFNHHEVTENEGIARQFPNIFLIIPDSGKAEVAPVAAPVVEEAPVVVVEEASVVEEAPVVIVEEEVLVTEGASETEIVSSEDVENVVEAPVFDKKKKK